VTSTISTIDYLTDEPGMPTADHYLRIPQADEWLNSNDRRHKRAEARVVKMWRDAAATWARSARLPKGITPVRIVARLSFPTNAHRDPGNWYPTAKACIDGLRDAGVLAEDTAAHVVGPDMRLGPNAGRGQRGVIVLELYRLAAVPADTSSTKKAKPTGPVSARRPDTGVTRARATLPAALELERPPAPRFDPNPTVDGRDPEAYAKYAERLDVECPGWWAAPAQGMAPGLLEQADIRREIYGDAA
jgi:crossover junction endodeoxyribonuclease RusA